MEVHRLRTLPFDPSSVRALAYEKSGKVLALVREKGSVELWRDMALVHSISPTVAKVQARWGESIIHNLVPLIFILSPFFLCCCCSCC